MTQRISRRQFLTAIGSLLGLAACDLAPPEVRRLPTTPTPLPSDATITPSATGLPVSLAPTVTPGSNTGVSVRGADGYVALAPAVLRAAQTEHISVSLFRGDRPAIDDVKVSLVQNGRGVAEVTGTIDARGSLGLALPKLAAGDYELQVAGQTFSDKTTVRVEEGMILFVETDKPIYKPGQTIHIRLLGVDAGLKPATGEATVEVMDAKGIKVFRTTAAIDAWGIAEVELPLSTEPNEGVWKVLATNGKRSAERDVRVERYVLPKYAIKVELRKPWALVSEHIAGTVSAEYSFGKPVRGEVEIVAQRYAGVWEEYARVTHPIDGRLAFDLPPIGYAAGSPNAGGMAEARLDITVREESTGYTEQTSELVTISATPVNVRVIPESNTFKPGLPFNLLVVAETPDGQPLDATVRLNVTYTDSEFAQFTQETHAVQARSGVGRLHMTPPAKAVAMTVDATTTQPVGGAGAQVTVRSGYSPTGSFIHVEQLSQGPLKAGDLARFKVSATREATTYYVEVLGRGSVVFSMFAGSPEIAITLTPEMAPEARLLVYQVLPNAEIAADYLPFKVSADYPQRVEARFDREEVKPGEELNVVVQTEGPARVGLAAVDRSVFILAENRLNLQQVFDELERLYMAPQVELHDVAGGDMVMPWQPMDVPGAKETFQQAGVVVMSNRQVPAGKRYEPTFGGGPLVGGVMEGAAAAASGPDVPQAVVAADSGADARAQPQAQPQRIRQFFPETWVWALLNSDAAGRATHRVTAPDSITTWMLRAVSLSQEKGLGIAEAELRVIQPFFVSVDLPYSAIRFDEFPVQIALYNYSGTPQEFTVDLEQAPWFDLIGARSAKVTVAPSSVGAASFPIRPTALGVQSLNVTARGQTAADAIVKELIIEPEGVAREIVENVVLAPGAARTLELVVPRNAIPGSPRAYVALTGNVLSQTIDGLEKLLQMPFGCGEQNMILFAPNVFVTRYLKETAQLKPEIMAKAEKLMLTGYQRELIYRRDDASFSAFGQSDQEGSLWLTAFVLKTFAQARGLIFVDDAVLASASAWITGHQQADGSFDPVGFVHHQELLGGLSGKPALTAFVAIALHEAGDSAGVAAAVRYLEGQLDGTDDPYAVAIMAYALVLAKSGRAQAARDKLITLAHESDEGLFWGEDRPVPLPGVAEPQRDVIAPHPGASAAIETTAYAILALLQGGDLANASKAARWLAAKRNAYGGYDSTQDTIVALQAMTTAASRSRADVDTTITLSAGSWRKDVRINAGNADVLQILEAPAGERVMVEGRGKGQVMAQWVQRFNLPQAAEQERSAFTIDVQYGAAEVAVNDLLHITATITFTPPPLPSAIGRVRAGMVVLDIAVPTGFAAVEETLTTLVAREAKLKRYELAGRKVVFYIEDMEPEEALRLTFDARALYPVRAQPVASQVYAYYRREWKAESLGGSVKVT